MTNAPPSIDPADEGTLLGVFKLVLSKFLANTDDCLPAIVKGYDRASNRATVQPLIQKVSTINQTFSRAPVASVPVFQIGGGNVALLFNINPGDLGWIKATDRDISLFMQNFAENGPNTDRMHSFEDAVFFPDNMRGYTINAEDEENCVLQTLDGTQRISIWPDRIKMTSGSSAITIQDTQITIDTDLVTFTGDINGTGARGVGLGEAAFAGILRGATDVIGGPNNISLSTHVHVNSGGTGDSGEPKP